MFINGIEGQNKIFFATDGIDILDAIEYNKTEAKFYKVKINNSYLRIKASDKITTIYNVPINFQKMYKYLFIVAGKNFDLKTLLIKEEILNLTNIYIKIINATNFNEPINISLTTEKDSLKYQIQNLSTTDYIEIKSNKLNNIHLTDKNGATLLIQKNQELNYKNNLIIIKGSNTIIYPIFTELIGYN